MSLGWAERGLAPLSSFPPERSAHLSPDAQWLAVLLAVLGRPADKAVLELLWPDEPGWVSAEEELLAQDLVQEQDGALAFKSTGLRERLLGNLPDDHKRAVHLRIGEVLTILPTADAAERLHHYVQAHDWPGILREALSAAETALAANRHEELVSSLELAREAVTTLQLPVTDQRRWSLLLLEESTARLADRGSTWHATLNQIAAVAEASGRRDWRVEALVRRGQALREEGQPQQAEETLRAAVTLANGFKLGHGEAQARIALASVLDDRGAINDALQETTQAIPASSSSGDAALSIRTLSTHAYMLMRGGQVVDADILLTPVLDHPAVAKLPVLAARLTRQLGIIRLARRHYESGLTLLRESARRMRQVRDAHGMLLCQTSLCYELTRFGVHDEALSIGETTITLARQLDARVQLCALLNLMAGIHCHRGQLAAALPLVEESVALANSLGLGEYTAASLHTSARIALAQGRVDQARLAILGARKLLATMMHPTVNVDHTAAQVCLAAGERAQARQYGLAVLSRWTDEGIPAPELSAVMWAATEVLAALDGPQAVRAMQLKVYDRFLDDVVALTTPVLRRAFITANAACRAMAGFRGHAARRLVQLPARPPSSECPLSQSDMIPVVWNFDGLDHPPLTIARRRQQLVCLVREATEQGAIATAVALSETLAVSIHTIRRDLAALRRQGVPMPTDQLARRNRDATGLHVRERGS